MNKKFFIKSSSSFKTLTIKIFFRLTNDADMNINAKYFQTNAFFIEKTTRVIEKNSKFVELFFMFETRLFARNNKSN